MATFLSSINNVLLLLRWEPLTAGNFSSPPPGHPGPAIKTLYNKAKNQVLNRIGFPLIEKEFVFNTTGAITDLDHPSASFTTAGLFADGIFLVSGGPVPDSTWVNRKITFVANAVTDATNVSAGWERIISIPASNQIQLESSYDDGVAFTSSADSWSIYQDEYELNPTARQITSAWTGDGSLNLSFVDEDAELDQLHPGKADIGQPREMALFRSSTSGNIWQCQLYPAPKNPYIVHYKATTHMPDFSTANEVIELEPEIVSMIEDACTQRAFALPVMSDPESSIMMREIVNNDMDEWAESNTPPAARRRRHRRGPDEGISRRSNPRRIVVE